MEISRPSNSVPRSQPTTIKRKPRKQPTNHRFIEPTQRQALDTTRINPIEDAARLERAAKHEAETVRLAEMAQICGWPPGQWGIMKLEEAYRWPILVEEAERSRHQYVDSWSCRVPEFRVVQSHVRAALTAERDPWTACDEALYDWEAEDYYARFILRLMSALHDSGKFMALVGWIFEAQVDERIYILFNMLLLVHYQTKHELWRSIPILPKLGILLTGRKRREF